MQERLIRLPWPDKRLNPNFKRSNHWTAYRKVEAAYREMCWGLTLEQTGASPSGLPERIPMTITFHPPDKRHRDRDNMISSFKQGQDGIADALGVDDKRFEPTYEFGEKVKGGCVLVHVRAAE